MQKFLPLNTGHANLPPVMRDFSRNAGGQDMRQSPANTVLRLLLSRDSAMRKEGEKELLQIKDRVIGGAPFAKTDLEIALGIACGTFREGVKNAALEILMHWALLRKISPQTLSEVACSANDWHTQDAAVDGLVYLHLHYSGPDSAGMRKSIESEIRSLAGDSSPSSVGNHARAILREGSLVPAEGHKRGL